MPLRDRLTNWLAHNTEQLVFARIPDPDATTKMVADRAYFGIWLTHAFLERDVNWFHRQYAAVYVSARFDVAGTTTTLTKLAQPAEGMLGPGVWVNYPVTGLVPYRGGTVEMDAGLTALERTSYLGAAVDVLTSFSALIAPPLSEAISIAGRVTDGIEKVLDAGGEDIVLGLHQAFAAPGGGGDHELEPCYLALIKAESGELDPAELSVHESRLQVGAGDDARPLKGYSYMLFRIEARSERDDWRFERFNSLIAKAIEAHFAGEAERFDGYRNTVLAEILKSPDLTAPDRFRVARAVALELKEVTETGQFAVGEEKMSLSRIVDVRAGDIDDPTATSEISLPELLAE